MKRLRFDVKLHALPEALETFVGYIVQIYPVERDFGKYVEKQRKVTENLKGIVSVAKAPVASFTWYPSPSSGSSKPGTAKLPHPGNPLDRQPKPVEFFESLPDIWDAGIFEVGKHKQLHYFGVVEVGGTTITSTPELTRNVELAIWFKRNKWYFQSS
ncbi:unnamed protein product [Schistocephalus solidus]|uniref:Peptidase A1 domain-containing protein n=1 Tax=Schistocephalus solidus TaxID=70667 RepID=A0A183SAD4_SCHSO|nr:unnamed protein product [Schistocephalus solidus]